MARYEMSDGSVLGIGGARHRCAEVLFAPFLVGSECEGVHSALNECARRCDLGVRRRLISNVTLVRGASAMAGFARRLLSECAANDHNAYEYGTLRM